MSTIKQPVVWCSNPNSSSQKPTAFALHGIQLEGNITEKHVLALREVISAAAEGRLLLPSDGGVVLLECGIRIASLVVSKHGKRHDAIESPLDVTLSPPKAAIQREPESGDDAEKTAAKLEPKYSDFDAPELSQYDYKYEFLCCAKCMEEHEVPECGGDDGERRAAEAAACAEKVCCDEGAGKCIFSVHSACQPHADLATSPDTVPIYATVKKHKPKYRDAPPQIAKDESRDLVEKKVPSGGDESSELISVVVDVHAEPAPAEAKHPSRKTSVDSSCTVGSMDSGFIEMQKLEQAAAEVARASPAEAEQPPSNGAIKECLAQSRSRRKSYEEFKALFHRNSLPDSELAQVREHELSLPLLDQKEKIRARRKSYEEFKMLVREQYENSWPPASNFTRRNSQRPSLRKQRKASKMAIAAVAEDSPSLAAELAEHKAEPARDAATASTAIVAQSQAAARTRDEQLKRNSRIYDKLISYGTIYDIMQKKADIYYKTYRKYDTYMTYGTIYEILQRKSDNYEIFRRKRNSSAKYKTISDGANEHRKQHFGTIYDIIQRKQLQATKTQSLPNGISGLTEMSKYGTADEAGEKCEAKKTSKIYDMIQSELSEAALAPAQPRDAAKSDAPAGNVINRFSVKKISEAELNAAEGGQVAADAPSGDRRSPTYSEPEALMKRKKENGIKKVKNSNRMRRFSHILSYTSKLMALESVTDTIKEAEEVGDKRPERADPTERVAQFSADLPKCRKLSMPATLEPKPKIVPRKQSLLAPGPPPAAAKPANSPAATCAAPVPMPKSAAIIDADARHRLLVKKSKSRRLSEFTRGEFLNEKP